MTASALQCRFLSAYGYVCGARPGEVCGASEQLSGTVTRAG